MPLVILIFFRTILICRLYQKKIISVCVFNVHKQVVVREVKTRE